MYVKKKKEENVGVGCTKVTQITVYETTGKRKDEDGHEVTVEKNRGPYFCQTREQELIFRENNSGGRTETFGVELLESTAKTRIDDPENVKQFTKKKEQENG